MDVKSASCCGSVLAALTLTSSPSVPAESGQFSSFIVASMGADSRFHQDEIWDESCLDWAQNRRRGPVIVKQMRSAVSDSSEARKPTNLESLQTAGFM
ncbi:Hypothetical predicted protein [Scomber scombrus]|uniref:Secreted protein n=1 Tax=Scomber scombrus TaxID=13677 RepID=A0AAV1Q3A5_SCOSC